jgi:gamma-glutamylcyclotransferase (GGCT)/AIG2-like uncharacterized protein YtfP
MTETNDLATTTEHDKSAKKVHPWYSLTSWALAVGGLFWAIGIIINGLHSINTEPLEVAVPETMGALVGGLIMLVVMYGLALLLGLMFGKRRLVLSTAFVAFVLGVNGTLLAVSLNKANNAAQTADALDELGQLNQKYLEQERVRTKSGATDIDLQALQDSQVEKRKIVDSTDGRARLALEVMLEMNENIVKASKAYNQTQVSLIDRQLLDPSWVESLDDLAAARTVIQTFIEANEMLKTAVSYPEKQIQAKLAARGMTDQQFVEGVIKGTRESPNYHTILEIRRTDDEFAHLLLELYDFYETKWGAWQYDHENSMVLFDTDEDLATWQDITSRIQAIVVEQESLRQQVYDPVPNGTKADD